MRTRCSPRALWRNALAILLFVFAALLVGCGPSMAEAPPARAPLIGRYPMRPLITDPRVARKIGQKALAKIGYDEIIRLAVQKEWLRYTDHVLVQAAAAAGFWPVFTPYAVTAGVTSQVDTPAPGPADVVALGILVLGLIDAGMLDGAILTSAGVETATDTAVDTAEDIERYCSDLLVECLENPKQPSGYRSFGSEKDCGACYRYCKNEKGEWPTDKCPRPGQEPGR